MYIDHLFFLVETIGGPPQPTVTITASDPSASEAGDAGRFTITLIGDIGNSLNVGYGIGGTAVNGEDYETIPSQVTIPTGQAAVSLDIRPIDDGAAEGPETVEIAIASNSEYRIGAPSAATVTIGDDDGSAAVAASEQTVSGTVVAGNYLDTRSSDDVNEAIREESYGGGQRSRLEHRWTFNLAGATTWVFEAEAHHDSTVENFRFEYSTDGSNWHSMLTTVKRSDDDTVQSFPIPANLSGTVFVRVVDTSRARGDAERDTVVVDLVQFVAS